VAQNEREFEETFKMLHLCTITKYHDICGHVKCHTELTQNDLYL